MLTRSTNIAPTSIFGIVLELLFSEILLLIPTTQEHNWSSGVHVKSLKCNVRNSARAGLPLLNRSRSLDAKHIGVSLPAEFDAKVIVLKPTIIHTVLDFFPFLKKRISELCLLLCLLSLLHPRRVSVGQTTTIIWFLCASLILFSLGRPWSSHHRRFVSSI
jgi:hypothetical protein